jgi:hypothetical protein
MRVEDLAGVLVVAYGVASLALGVYLRAVHARTGDVLARSLATVCLIGGLPAAVFLAVVHTMGGPLAVLHVRDTFGRLAIAGCYATIGAGIVTSVLYLRAAYYPGSRALVAASIMLGGFFVMEAVVVPTVGFTASTAALAFAHFPIEIGVYGWAAFEGLTFARNERARPEGDPALARRHRLVGIAFVMPALWVASSFLLIRHPELMSLGAGFGLAAHALVWRAFPRLNRASSDPRGARAAVEPSATAAPEGFVGG